MDSLSNPATLLVLTSKEDEAVRIITSLRNGGLAVRGVFAHELERIEELAAADPFDLILCCDYDPRVGVETCMEMYRELDLDVPLIIISDRETDPALLIRAMREGARDLTEHGDTEHLQLVVARELSDLGHRRATDRLRRRLTECEQRARELVDATTEAVAFIQDGAHIQVNPAYQQIFGFASAEDLDGFPLLDLIAPDHQGVVRQALRLLQKGTQREVDDLQIEGVRIDDGGFPARMSLSQSVLEGEPCLRVTVRKDAGEAAPAGAAGLMDGDTGLPNRTALMEELARRLDRGQSGAESFAVLFIGINGFHQILQNEGLTVALETAAAFGNALKEAMPPGSYLARVSDDGFLLFVAKATQADAVELSAQIGHKVRVAPGQTGGTQRRCSTGLMLAEPGTDTPEDVLNTVYRDYLFGALDTEHQVQSTVAVSVLPESGSTSSELSDEDRRFASTISRALEEDGFQLYYQPIVSLKGDSQENYNVLLRLRDTDRSVHEAKEFLGAAVQAGRMVAVDRWVMRKATAEIAAKRAQGHKVNFFVNIAEETLQEEKLLIWICDNLREHEARGNWLTFQILEDHARRHSAAFSRLSEGLHKVKCRVALNHFGLGPNSEALLKSLRMDFVKFSPELGKGLADDDAKQRRLLELSGIAREAGVRSVVTGVEDARTLTVLWTAGIDYVQGNFLQKPSPSIDSQG